MSPTVKKILIGGGVAVGAYLIYSMIKKSSSSTGSPLSPAVSGGTLAAPTRPTPSRVSGIEAELGLDEDMGSLGGGYK